jgi:hypothetical protein
MGDFRLGRRRTGSQKIRLTLFLAIFLSPLFVFALTYTETFSTTAAQSSSQLVWNIALGKLHPPLWVENWNDGAVQDTAFDVGDGHHGAFNI